MNAHAAPALAHRVCEIFAGLRRECHRRTDRNFAILMLVQWISAIALALAASPFTWAGEVRAIHEHVWSALFMGGLATVPPVVLAFAQAGRLRTRLAVAVGQALMSAVLIHVTGGRIETHFHLFGSLAFLAFYRDWRVLLTASAVTAAHHFAGGVFQAASVFGTSVVNPWRWLEHVGWVVFEDAFLLISIRQSLAEMRGMAERQARLEAVNVEIEQQVAQRTAELSREVEERRATEQSLRESQSQLAEMSRHAGMAEVATSVLHNVGNVLNSVNVSGELAVEKVRHSEVSNVARLAALLEEHKGDLPRYLTSAQGSQLPAFLGSLARHLVEEQHAVLFELEMLSANIEHIKEIVAMQQSYARICGVLENLSAASLVEDAIRFNAGALERHGVTLVREFNDAPSLTVDKHKVLLILVNLIRNAKYALDERGAEAKKITLRIDCPGDGYLQISVCDDGIGIPAENLTRIFAHGFTTRAEGHGFGLHSAALAAAEMGGSLTVQSDGLGGGAIFTLSLPLQTTRSP